jgi:hypothetical protein
MVSESSGMEPKKDSDSSMSAKTALRVCGGFLMLRAIVFTIYPSTMMTLLNYPPKMEKAGGLFGGTPTEFPMEDVQLVKMVIQFYGFVQGGMAGVALEPSRSGAALRHPCVHLLRPWRAHARPA